MPYIDSLTQYVLICVYLGHRHSIQSQQSETSKERCATIFLCSFPNSSKYVRQVLVAELQSMRSPQEISFPETQQQRQVRCHSDIILTDSVHQRTKSNILGNMQVYKK